MSLFFLGIGHELPELLAGRVGPVNLIIANAIKSSSRRRPDGNRCYRVAWEQVPGSPRLDMAATRRWALRLDRSVRAAIEDVCGARVVEAWTQPGGFSPGLAARVRGANGGRFFVKAVSADANPDAPLLHRQEARILAALGPVIASRRLPVPRLRGTVDHRTRGRRWSWTTWTAATRHCPGARPSLIRWWRHWTASPLR